MELFTKCFFAFVVIFAFLIGACASKPPATDESLTEKAEPVEGTTNSPGFQKLHELLAGLGYEGIGLQYETDSTLDLLTQVFSDSKVKNRKIKLVYTGLNMAYDSRHESLTIGGTAEASQAVSYIESKVPSR